MDWVVAALFAGLAAANAAAPPASAARRVLVLDVTPMGVERAAAAPLTDSIARVFQGRPDLQATTLAEVQDLLSLDQSRQLAGCEGESACLVELTQEVEAAWLLTATLGKVGETFLLSLSAVDPAGVQPTARQSLSAATVAELVEHLPGAVRALFGWEGAAAQPTYHLPQGQHLSFAVFDLQAAGVPADIAGNLTQILSAELKRVEGANVISRDDIAALLQLEADKDLLGCEGDASCLAQIAGALGVDKLVAGGVAKLAHSYVINLRLIDARQALVDNRVTESFEGPADQLIRAIRHAGRLLLGLEAPSTGTVAVTASEGQAQVFINGVPQGALPRPPVTGLPPGRHSVLFTKDGFFDWRGDVYVEPGDTTVVWAELQSRPEPWYAKWWVWAIAGGVVAAGVGTAVYFALPQPTSGGGTVTFDGAP